MKSIVTNLCQKYSLCVLILSSICLQSTNPSELTPSCLIIVSTHRLSGVAEAALLQS